MKRKELEVGKSYYWARPSDWREDYEGKEAHVVDLEVWVRSSAWSGKHVVRPGATGGGLVHVKVRAFRDEDSWAPHYVRPQDLRGEYAPEHAAWRERKEAKTSAEATALGHALHNRAERHAVIEHAKKLGFGTVEPAHRSDTRVSITTGQLAELLSYMARHIPE